MEVVVPHQLQPVVAEALLVRCYPRCGEAGEAVLIDTLASSDAAVRAAMIETLEAHGGLGAVEALSPR